MALKFRLSQTPEFKRNLRIKVTSPSNLGASRLNMKQNITSHKRVIFGNLQKCMSCGGVKVFSHGKLTGMQVIRDKNNNLLPYRHLNDCKEKGKF